MKKTRKVYTLRETNEFRRAVLGEWCMNGDGHYRSFHQGQTDYPVRIVTFEQTEEQN